MGQMRFGVAGDASSYPFLFPSKSESLALVPTPGVLYHTNHEPVYVFSPFNMLYRLGR